MTLVLPKMRYRVWRRRPEILLCPNIPKPMHGLAPRVVLGGSWWDKTRKEAYDSTNRRCIACGVHKYRAKARKWLEGHELYHTDYRLGRLTYLETVPLCHFCHNYIHDGRLQMLLEKGLVHHQKYAAIIQHGNRVLAEANLCKLTRKQREEELLHKAVAGELAEWSDWRLVLFGSEYPPLYCDENEWRLVHGRQD